MPTKNDAIKTLTSLDIVLSIYNQEKLISRVLGGIFANTISPFTLILIFDGCTDNTKSIALEYCARHKSVNLKQIITKDAANVYETRANNIGFKLSTADYMITLQDDMVIEEPGWDIRLTYPLRKFDDVLGVTSRIAQDIDYMDKYEQRYTNRAGRELWSLPRSCFAVRDILNRGPIAFRVDFLRKLNYLNEDYAPSDLDDADLSLRAWENYHYKVGGFWINYRSDSSWSKARSTDSTMNIRGSVPQNAERIMRDHANYFNSKQKHNEDITIPEDEIDYPKIFDRSALAKQIRQSQWDYLKTHYPSFLYRRIKDSSKQIAYRFFETLGFKQAHKIGIRKALKNRFTKDTTLCF